MKIHHLAASAFGNILEWLDIGLFIYLSPLIGKQFFPHQASMNATIMVYAVFAVGFICRPLGSILFGHLGDRIGRARTLIFSIMAVTLATLALGLLPNYNTIGILAPVIFIFLRILQGLSIGGEYSGVMIYLAESSPNGRRGFFTSFAAVGANAGFLLATVTTILLNTQLSSSALQSWGWRIPFLFSGALGCVIFLARFNLVETSAYLYLKRHQQIIRVPLLAALRQAPRQLLQIMGLTSMGATFYFIFFGYLPSYLAQFFGVSLTYSLTCQSIFLAGMLLLLPMAGLLGDRFGRKKMLLITAIGMIGSAFPCFYLLQHEVAVFIFVGLSVATILSSLEQGNTLVTIVENCPVDFRYSGVAFAYNSGNAIFGGTAPLVVSLLTQKVSHFAPAYYLMVMCLISLIVVMTLKETYKTDFSYDI
jgi:MFS transporter, MHS family, proline/betaine transporter